MTIAPEAVFIGGCPRSGTTLLASLLGGLPGCVVTPESQFKQRAVHTLQRHPGSKLRGAELQRQLSRDLRFQAWRVPLHSDDLEVELGSEGLRHLLLKLAWRVGTTQGLPTELTTWIDHTPQNIESGLALTKLFPRARIIHIVRDPRAVAASLLPLDWGPQSPAGVAELWRHRLAHGLALESALPESIRRVHYEQLCREPDRILGELADWVGIPRPATPLKPVSGFLPRYTLHQHSLIGSRPLPDRIEAWRDKLAPWQQRQIETLLGELMPLVGYQPDSQPMEPGERPLGPWRRWIMPAGRRVLGQIRHRRRKRLHRGRQK